MSLLETIEFVGILAGLAILMWDNCLAVRPNPPERSRTKSAARRRVPSITG